MTKRLTAISELPDWLKKQPYSKRLSKVDWFREIRKRQMVMRILKMSRRGAHFSGEVSGETRNMLLNMLQVTPHPDSTIFYVVQSNRPVHDLTAGEALYFCSAHRDEDLIQFGKTFDELLSLWHKALKEDPEGPTPLFGEYEHQIEKVFDELKNNPCASKLDEPIEKFLDGVGNPWLSYGRPLNGSPITVDTQYDDETIVSYFKGWLAENRKTEGERVRRPFTQNDFDDWEYFKIREIFDVDTWATLMNVKILCWRRPSFDHPCRLSIDQGRNAFRGAVGCG